MLRIMHVVVSDHVCLSLFMLLSSQSRLSEREQRLPTAVACVLFKEGSRSRVTVGRDQARTLGNAQLTHMHV